MKLLSRLVGNMGYYLPTYLECKSIKGKKNDFMVNLTHLDLYLSLFHFQVIF